MDIELDSDRRWQLVRRIVASPTLSRSARLSDFLLFVSEQAILGRSDELNEAEIGAKVFGRSPDYVRSDDNIVRANASRLRQKLEEYFANEGQAEEQRIVLPRGTYVPRFEGVEKPAPAQLWASRSPKWRHAMKATGVWLQVNRRIIRGAIAGFCLGLAVAFGWTAFAHHGRRGSKGLAALMDVLCKQGEQTFIVPGDAGLNMYTNMDQRTVDVQDYTRGTYLAMPPDSSAASVAATTFPARKYLTISDMQLISNLIRMRRPTSGRLNVRFARDLRFGDLDNDNLILLGSPNYNPWINLFNNTVDFTMKFNGDSNSITIVNKAPRKNEKKYYQWRQDDQTRTGYAVVSLTNNLQGTGKVLLVEGTTSDGIATASDFLFNPKEINPVIAEAKAGGKGLSNFDLLLGTTFYNGGSLPAKILAIHFHR